MMEFNKSGDFQKYLRGDEVFIEDDVVIARPLELAHDVRIAGKLTTHGRVAISGALRVGGPLVAEGDLRVQGEAAFGGDLTLHGDLFVNGAVAAGGSIDTAGRALFNSQASVQGRLRSAKSITAKGDLAVGGSVRAARELIVAGGIKAGAGIKVGRELTAGAAITAAKFVWADGPISCAGPIEAAFVYSFVYDLQCSYFKNTQLPFGQKYWAEMPPMAKFKERILGAVRCFEEYAALATKAENQEICAWPGWHWIVRGHLNNFFGFTEQCVPPLA